MNNKRIKLTKAIVSKVATVGSSIVISSAITNNLPGTLTWPKKIAVVVGSYMIAEVINDAVRKQTDKTIDDAVMLYNKVVTYLDLKKA